MSKTKIKLKASVPQVDANITIPLPEVKLTSFAPFSDVKLTAIATSEVQLTDLVSNKSQLPRYQVKLKSSESLAKQFPMRARPSADKRYDDLSTTERGDRLVWRVYDTLSSCDNVTEIANISGISGNSFDIVVRTKDGRLRGIQVKTLASRKVSEQYQAMLLRYEYHDHTLMIFANITYNRFVVTQWQDIKNKSNLSVNFSNVNYDQSFTAFMDIKLYENYINQQVTQAIIINDVREGITSSGQLAEYDFTRTVKSMAESQGILFEYENTDDSPIDFYLNGHACQSKITGIVKKLQYHFHLTKSINRKDCPYTDSDGIQYFILGINDEQYKHDVLIVPIQHFIQKGYIKTDHQDGITSVCLPPPQFHKYHWSNCMWNNWSIIKDQLSVVETPISNKLNQYGDTYVLLQPSGRQVNKYQLHISFATFTYDKIQYYVMIPNDLKKQSYPGWIWIISKSELIREGKVPTVISPDRNLGITPPSPYYSQTSQYGICWSTKYWQKV